MTHRTTSALFKPLMAFGLASLLSACGGGAAGFPPVVTGFKVQSLQYGRTAVLYAGGNDLRSDWRRAAPVPTPFWQTAAPPPWW